MYEYVVARGAGFALAGKDYNVGDVISEPDALKELDADEHKKRLCVRVAPGHPCGVNAPEPEKPAADPQPAVKAAPVAAPAVPAAANAPKE